MDGLSVLYYSVPAPFLYEIGNAHGWLAKSAKAAAAEYHLSGRLYLAKSGWLLLSVPNALVRGVFDALQAPGVELPFAGTMNVPNVDKDLLNAHISVMTAAEVEAIGADKINERGHTFRYTLGPVKEVPVSNIAGVSKVWFIQVASPDLTALRKSYGLSSKVKDDEPFHITVALRRRNVLRANDTSKCYKTSAETTDEHRFSTTYECGCSGRCTCPDSCICKKSGYCGHSKAAADILHGGDADNMPDSRFPSKALAEGKKHEHEHTTNDQIAGEIAKDHLQEDPAYYKKVRQIEKAAMPEIIKKLREAKAHSDNKRYDRKNAILRELMKNAPAEWQVDDPTRYHVGITHVPTQFRFHADPTIIPPTVVVGKAAAQNPYIAQLFTTPMPSMPGASIGQKVVHYLQNVKTRGDWQANAQENTKGLLAELNPAERQRQYAAIASKNYPRPDFLTRLIQHYNA